MKKWYALLLLSLISYTSYACSCIDIDDFCSAVGETSIVVLVKITDMDASTGRTTLERIEILQGDVPESFEIQSLFLCPDSSELLELNGEALVHLGIWGDDYHLALCALGVLPLKNGKLQGKVTSTESNMSYEKFKETELDCFDETSLLTRDDITIYPNPFVQTLFYTNKHLDIQGVEIYNIKGQLLYEEKTIESLSGHIDVPNLPAGIYMLRIVANDRRFAFKVVKAQ